MYSLYVCSILLLILATQVFRWIQYLVLTLVSFGLLVSKMRALNVGAFL
jgi:hypothetical protein